MHHFVLNYLYKKQLLLINRSSACLHQRIKHLILFKNPNISDVLRMKRLFTNVPPVHRCKALHSVFLFFHSVLIRHVVPRISALHRHVCSARFTTCLFRRPSHISSPVFLGGCQSLTLFMKQRQTPGVFKVTRYQKYPTKQPQNNRETCSLVLEAHYGPLQSL